MILTGDCIEVMAGLPADSVDAVVTDPPYGLEFMGKEWDSFGLRRGRHVGKDREFFGQDGDFPAGRAPSFAAQNLNPKCAKCGRYEYGPTPEAAAKRGRTHHKCICEIPDFRGRSTGPIFQEWCRAWGEEAIRVTKPGGYLLAFGGTRTHHRLVCGLEDAGWIIRDELDWIYASGFPKGKANLKPAHEPIVLARKPGPLRPLAIDACRIPSNGETPAADRRKSVTPIHYEDEGRWKDRRSPETYHAERPGEQLGRWPSNVLLSDPELFDTANPGVVGSGAVSGSEQYVGPTERHRNLWGPLGDGKSNAPDQYGDTGGYSRFFVIPKSARSDREPVLRGQLEAQAGKAYAGAERGGATFVDGERVRVDSVRSARENAHPTVKPTDLMRHLVRLVTPVGGTVLDCFLGSGSTAIAAEMEGFAWVGIEKEPEYVAIAEARLNGTQRGLGLDVPAPTKAPPKTHPDLEKHQPKRRAPSDSYSGGWPGLEPPEEVA